MLNATERFGSGAFFTSGLGYWDTLGSALVRLGWIGGMVEGHEGATRSSQLGILCCPLAANFNDIGVQSIGINHAMQKAVCHPPLDVAALQ